jgi:O-antigen ligase
MSLNEGALTTQKKRIYAFSVLLGIVFFALIFYLRNMLQDFSLPFAYVFVGIILISLISGRMETMILILLIITSTVFEMLEFPTIPIMIGDMYFSDVLIFLLLLGRIVKRVTVEVTIIPKPMGYPIVAYILVGIFAFLYATVGFQVSTLTAGVELRAIFHMSLFFLVMYYIRNDRQLRTLLLGVGVISCVVSILLLIQYILGSGTSLVSGRVEILSTADGKFEGITRVLVPGTSIIIFSLNTLIAIYILKGLKRRWRNLVILGIAVLAMGLILTFTRVYWAMVFAAIVLLILLTRRELSVYPRATFLTACAAMTVVLILQASVLNSSVIKEAVLNRTMSILRVPENFQHDTLFMRYLESRYAWEKVKENPLLGLGLGKSYRPLIFRGANYENTVGGTYLHNGFLATQMKMGIAGTLTFFWLMGAFFFRVLKRWRRIRDPLYKAVVLGIAVSIAGMLLHNLMASPFLTVFWASVAAVGIGVVEKIFQLEDLAS